MKRKSFILAGLTLGISLLTAFSSFAAGWELDSIGWRWWNDDGTYLVDTWAWLDGNQDGIAEHYYLGPDGYCLLNAMTPDGYVVNENGAQYVVVYVPKEGRSYNVVLNNIPREVKKADILARYDVNGSGDIEKEEMALMTPQDGYIWKSEVIYGELKEVYDTDGVEGIGERERLNVPAREWLRYIDGYYPW